MKRVFSSVTAIALGLGVLAPPAAAELRYENGSGGSVQFYGQFSPAYQWVDDGLTTTDTAVDNAHSNSRVGLWVTQPMGTGTFTFNFETALGLRSSDGVSQTNTPKGISWNRTRLRKIDLAYDTGTHGKFYLGQGSMASDGIADADFSGTSLVNYNGISDTAGSFRFRTAAGALSTIAISAVTPSLDGGRRGRLRYDTPEFGGFTLAVAAGEEILASNNSDTYYDVALRYAKTYGATKVAAGLGFSRRDSNGTHTDDTFGSLRVLLDSGLNFAVAAGSRDTSGSYVYAKLGYLGNWWAIGQTALSVDLYDGSDFVSNGSSSRAYGLGIVQQIDSANLEAYLGLRRYELSEVATSYRDINSILFGARWRF